MVGGVEPTSPKPIEVNTGSILHGAEEIGRHGAFELPSASVLLEGEVEQFSTKNGLSQNIQSRCWLTVGVRTKLHNGLAIGHDGNLVTALHVRHHKFWVAAL